MSDEETKVDTVAEETTSDAPATDEPSKKKKKHRRWPIVVIVIVVVIIAAGVGFYIWHDQPSFCNAFCHTPMDGYLETWEATPGEAAVDKYGNEVEDANGMLSCVHRVEADTNCLGCHEPTLSEQIGEGLAWVTGDYTTIETIDGRHVPEEKDLEQLTEARGAENYDEFCLNESCHDMTLDDLIEATSDYSRNPHKWQHGTVACNECHKAHRASVMYCSQCHSDAPLPEGWLTVSQANQLEM